MSANARCPIAKVRLYSYTAVLFFVVVVVVYIFVFVLSLFFCCLFCTLFLLLFFLQIKNQTSCIDFHMLFFVFALFVFVVIGRFYKPLATSLENFVKG